MGDDIYDDPLLRNPLHHYVDAGRLTFFGTEAFVRPWLPGLVPLNTSSIVLSNKFLQDMKRSKKA
jgi:hypothetical protein